MKRIHHSAALCAALFSPGLLLADGPVTIKRELQVGKTYHMEVEMEQSSKMEMAGQKMDQLVKTTTEVTTAVTKHAEPGKRRAKITYQRIAMDMNAGGKQMQFDSAKPSDDPESKELAKVFDKIVGKSVTMVLNDKNDIEELEGMGDLMRDAGPAGQIFNKDSLSQMMKMADMQAPDKPLNPGDKWPMEFFMPMQGMGKMTLSGECTYMKNVEHEGAKCVEIKMDGTLGMRPFKKPAASEDGDDPAAKQQAEMFQKLGMKMDGKFTSVIIFDPAAKIERTYNMNMDLTMTMNNPQTGEKMTVPMKQRMVQRLKKLEP